MKTILNVRLDERVKKQAQEMAQSMGLSLSVVVNALLLKMIKERKLELSVDAPVQLHAVSDAELSQEEKEEIDFLKQQNEDYFSNI